MAISGVARLQGKRPAAVFYPFGHPTPYAYEDYLGSESATRDYIILISSCDAVTRLRSEWIPILLRMVKSLEEKEWQESEIHIIIYQMVSGSRESEKREFKSSTFHTFQLVFVFVFGSIRSLYIHNYLLFFLQQVFSSPLPFCLSVDTSLHIFVALIIFCISLFSCIWKADSVRGCTRIMKNFWQIFEWLYFLSSGAFENFIFRSFCEWVVTLVLFSFLFHPGRTLGGLKC
jgi:hypothetical protein